jgi:hypothetical protein
MAAGHTKAAMALFTRGLQPEVLRACALNAASTLAGVPA